MLIPYCAVHDRLLHPPTRTWMPWEKARDALAQEVCPRRKVAPSDVIVVQTSCDRCIAITRQALCALIEPR